MLLSRKDWTQKNAPFAIQAAKGSGIFPETLLAMAIVESQGQVNGVWYPGAGLVAKKANNYFGIKKGVNWKGKTINLPTPKDPQPVSTFRVYPNFEASAKDYIKFLQVNKRYTNAGVFTAPNYQEQIIAIARAGYADGLSYADIVTKVANTVKKYIAEIVEPINKNKGLISIFVAGTIITLYLLNKKFEYA
jgi:flagellum-specific peptidoglycan hydrolase FlgJ